MSKPAEWFADAVTGALGVPIQQLAERLTCSACGGSFWRSDMKPAAGHYTAQVEHPHLIGACPHCGEDGTVTP